MNSLVPAVVERFDLGDVNTARTEAMVGSTNRLWRLQTDRGDFVIKEFSYDVASDLQRRERAAAFERHVYETATVLLPEPVRTDDGVFVVSLPGSRGDRRGVRVHRWLEGDRIGLTDDAFLATAGSSLHAIQGAGAAWSTERTGSIRWWDVDPLVVVDRLHDSHLSVLARDAGSVVGDALAVIEAVEAVDSQWIYSHCDHKPDNALDVGGTPAILDWDECGHCPPRLEAVEAALRWAGPTAPEKKAFRAFLDGYCEHGGDASGLAEPDFAKWMAALVGWFAFQTRRALGEWPSETQAERQEAQSAMRDTLEAMASSLSSLSTWASWY